MHFISDYKRQLSHLFFCYIFLVLTAVATIFLIFPSTKDFDPGNFGIYSFYILFDMDTFIFFFASIFIIAPNIVSIKLYQMKKGFLNFLFMRISAKQYLNKALLQSFISGFFLFLTVELTILVIMHFFYDPIFLSLTQETNLYFSRNAVYELILFLIISSIGFGVFLAFLTCLAAFIKNEYLCRSSGIIILIAAMLLYPLIGSTIVPFLLNYIPKNIPVRSLCSFTLPTNLISPGTTFEKEAPYTGWYSFIGSLLFYGILLFYMYKKLTKNNERLTK